MIRPCAEAGCPTPARPGSSRCDRHAREYERAPLDEAPRRLRPWPLRGRRRRSGRRPRAPAQSLRTSPVWGRCRRPRRLAWPLVDRCRRCGAEIPAANRGPRRVLLLGPLSPALQRGARPGRLPRRRLDPRRPRAARAGELGPRGPVRVAALGARPGRRLVLREVRPAADAELAAELV